MIKNEYVLLVKRNIIVSLLLIQLITGCNSLPSDDEIPTKQATATILSDPEPSSSVDIEFPTIVVSDEGVDIDQIVLLNNKVKSISAFENKYGELYLSSTNCSLLEVWGYSSWAEINEISFQGEIISTEVVDFINDGELYNTYQYTVSPMQDWIAFKEISGDFGQAYEFAPIQDVVIVKIDDSDNANQSEKRLTIRGGAKPSELTWSPDNRFLTFTDYDSNSISQVFIYEPNTAQKTQLTHFQNNYAIAGIKWSLDSSRIAIQLFEEYAEGAYDNGVIGIISIPTNEVEILPLEETHLDEFQIWWGDKNRLLIFAESDKSEWLFWVDTSSELIERKINLNSYGIFSVFPITDDLNSIVLLGSSLYDYSFQDDSFQIIDSSSNKSVFFFGRFQVIESTSGGYKPQSCY